MIVAGHAVRGTTRRPTEVPTLEAAGIEPFVADPDRVGTIVPSLQQVSIACVLLGSAAGDPERVAALHGPRLDMLLEKVLDTTVRGVVYEAAGSVAPQILGRGAELVGAACGRSRIPYALIDVAPANHRAWVTAALAAIDRVMA
jgi:hypothetical protein